MIFSRRRSGSGRHSRGERPDPAGQPDGGDGHGGDGHGGDDASVRGPYDAADAPTGVRRLDLGSLQIPAVSEVEVRVQANPDGAIQQVVLVHRNSALQLGVFAAPRTDGIWDEVRAEIRSSLLADGATAEEAAGEYGTELRARIQTQEGVTDLRFVGVDGPRWMVRGVYQGPAATDPAGAGPLAVCLEGLVVDRGQEAKPVREPLPLRLPRDAEAPGTDASPGAASPGAAPPGAAAPEAGPAVDGMVSARQSPNRSRPSPRPGAAG